MDLHDRVRAFVTGVEALPPGDAEATYRRGRRRRRTRHLALAGSSLVVVALVVGLGVNTLASLPIPDVPPIGEHAIDEPDGEPDDEPHAPDGGPPSIDALVFLRWEESVHAPDTLLDVVVDEDGYADASERLDQHPSWMTVDFDRYVLLFVTHPVGSGTCLPWFGDIVADGDQVEIRHGTIDDDGTYHPPGEPGAAPDTCRETGPETIGLASGIAVERAALPSGQVTFEVTGIEGIDFDPVTVDLPSRAESDRGPLGTTEPADADPDAIVPRCEDIDEVAPEDRVNSDIELHARQLEIFDEWRPLIVARDTRTPDERRYGMPFPGSIGAIWTDPELDRVYVSIAGGDGSVLREFTERYGTQLVCVSLLDEPGEPVPDDDAVIPLARIEGWPLPDHADEDWPAWFAATARLEIAADEVTAARAWSELVPDDLGPPAHGIEHPSAPGIYGSLDGIDFTSQVVGVWRGGESGSCPSWLAAIVTEDDGRVRYTGGGLGQGICTADFKPYTMIVVLARDQLPDLDTLPARLHDGWGNPAPEIHEHNEVVLYPTGD